MTKQPDINYWTNLLPFTLTDFILLNIEDLEKNETHKENRNIEPLLKKETLEETIITIKNETELKDYKVFSQVD